MPAPDPWAAFKPVSPSPGPDDWSGFPAASKPAAQSQAKPVAGPALSGDTVTGAVDGDTVDLSSGRHLRIWGVDAPEAAQLGYDMQGRPFAVGKQSTNALADFVRNGPLAIGARAGESYGRPVAPLEGQFGDVGKYLARNGNALAAPGYLASAPQRRFDYLQAERLARQNGLGLHKYRMQTPQDFRRSPSNVDLPQREMTAMFGDTPTPFAGMRPEVEKTFVQMLNDRSVKPEAIAEFAKANGGFVVDPALVEKARASSDKDGQPITMEYRDAPKVLTDLGDGALGATMRGVGNGVLPNMLEEVGAVVDSLGGTAGRENVWNSDRRWADIWANNADQNESITGFDDYAHPWATMGGEVAGGLVVPIGRVKSVADLAKFGAGYGFVSGLGNPGSLGERLGSGIVGAAEGAALTAAGGKIIEAAAPRIAKAASPLVERFQARNRAPLEPSSVPMSVEPLPSVSQDLPPAVRPMGQLTTEAQLRAASEAVAPGDVLPIPSNQVGSIEEAAAIEAGRFVPAKAPNERAELTSQTVRAWNGAEVPKVGPVDLVGWLRLHGGLADQGGELTHMGLNNAARRGMDHVGQEARFGPLVNNEGGQTLDDAAVRAWEAGYFPELTERPSVNQFLDGLRDTYEGRNRRFLPEDQPQLEAFNAARDERYALEQQRLETGQDVLTDKSVPAADPAPLPPVQAYEEWPAGGPDFAGNINLGKLDTPQDIKRALDTTERRVGGFDAATRGRVTQAETERLAGELGMTPESLLARRKGQAFNAEEALAARQILAKSGNELVNAAKRMRSLGDDPGAEALAEFRQKWMRHVAIQEQVAGATAEAGRALAQFRMAADSRNVRGDVLTAIVDGAGGNRRLQDAADALIDAFEIEPGKFNALAEQMAKPRLKDKAIELYYNMMLSGPATHMVNVTSNTLTSLGQLPEHATAALIGKARERFNRGAIDRVTASELGQRSFGLLQGFKEGLARFAETARTGETTDFVSKVEAQSQRAISGVKGEVIRTPSRLLSAEDELFKAVARRMELNGLAARTAHKEGLRGEDAAKRIAELVVNPPEDLLARTMDYGRYLTFQRPLGDIAGGVARMRNDSVLMTALVPFVRTPTNILKFAAERSPAAPLLKEWRADWLAGGAKRDLAIARVMVGTGFGAAIYEAALKGNVTGSAPLDPVKAQFMRADGWQPYSFKVGDTWYSYQRLDPFATTIGVAADLATKKDGMSKKQLDDYAMLLTASILKNMGDKTWLSSASDFVQALSDPQRYGPSYIRKMGAGFVTPALSSQVARSIDPVARDVRTLPDAIKARVPGLSMGLPAKRDIWGQPITNEGGLGPDVISPIWKSTEKNDPINAEMLAIGARFQSPDRYVTQDGKRVDLTPQQYESYSALAGQNTRRAIELLGQQSGWKSLADDQKAAAVKKAATKAKAEARDGLFGAGKTAAPDDPWSSFPTTKAAKPDPWASFKKPDNPDIAGDLQQAIPGLSISTGFRNKEYQADMRRRGYKPADNSAHLDGSSLDLIAPPGRSNEWLKQQVRRRYPNAKFLDEGDHLHTTFPGWFGAPVVGGAKSWGIVNPNGR